MLDGIWKKRTITSNWPRWIIDEKISQVTYTAFAKRVGEQKNLMKQAQVFRPMRRLKPTQQKVEELPESVFHALGGSKRDIVNTLASINKAPHNLWTGINRGRYYIRFFDFEIIW